MMKHSVSCLRRAGARPAPALRASVATLPPRRTLQYSTASYRPSTSRLPWTLIGATLAAGTAWAALELKPELTPTAHALEATPEGFYLDPTTKTPFPVSIPDQSHAGRSLKLVGTGVRTVSFLSIRVYTVGLYISEGGLRDIQSGRIKGFENYAADQLIPPYKLEETSLTGEALVSNLLATKNDIAVVIVPLRNTTLPHMRDGFSRAIMARLKLPHVASQMTEQTSEQALESISQLKSFFPSKTLAKGEPLNVYFRLPARTIEFTLDKPPTVLGTIDNELLARELLFSYLAPDKNGVISEELRQSVAKGFAGEPRG